MADFSKSKLIRLINLLSKAEYNDLESWLDLRQNRVPKKVKTLYLIFKKQYLKGNIEAITKQTIFKKIYPRETYNANYLNNHIRDFVKSLESYLIFLESQKSETNKYLYFRSLRNRGESSIFFKEITDYLNEQPIDMSYYHLFRLHQLLYSHPAYDEKYDRTSEYLSIQNEYLEGFFLEEKYTLLHELNVLDQALGPSKKAVELTNLEIYRNQSNSKVVALFEERFSRKTLLTFPIFDDFHKRYLEYFDSLSTKYKRIFLILCINDATRLSVSGQGDLMNFKLFNLYNFGMEEELVLTKSTVSPIMFNNFITVALKLNKVEFLKEFLWKRALLLPSPWSQDAITWAESKLAYQLGQFTKVIELNKKYKVKHWLYKLQIRVVLLQTYYDLVEQKEYRSDSLEKQLESFKTYLNRNKGKYQFRPAAYSSLISFTRKIHQINSGDLESMMKELTLVKEKVRKTKILFERNWLLEKIEEKLFGQTIINNKK